MTDQTLISPERPQESTTPGLTRLLTFLLPATTGMYSLYQGIQQILLPAQVENLDPANKVANLALLTTLAAIASMLALPIGGAVSDRTRSRFGKRTPWIVAAAVISGVLTVTMGLMTGMLALAVVYMALWFSSNFFQGALSAILPDRVPVTRRGVASAVIGLGTPAGILIGVNVSSRVEQATGYTVLAVILVATSVLLVVGAREASSLDTVDERVRGQRPPLRSFFTAFRSSDFSIAFASRALLFLAYFVVSGYLYYTVQDYVGVENLPDGNVAIAVSTLSTISTLTWVLVALLTGWLADRLDRRKLFVSISAVGVGASMLIPLLSPTWGGMVAYSVVSGAAVGTYFAVDLALMSLVLPDKKAEGRDLGLLAVATGLPQILSGVIAGALITFLGGYTALYTFGAICALGSGLIIMRIRGVK